MTAIIKRYAAPAAFSDSLVLDLEPLVQYPAGLLAEYRYKITAGNSAPPRQGSWAALTVVDSGAEPVFGAASATVNGRNLAIPQRPLPAGSFTILSVSRQAQLTGASGFQWLGGGADSANASLGLYRASSTLSYALRAGGSHVATLAPDGGDRYEAVFAVYDTVGSTGKLFRPRTNTAVTAPIAVLPATPTGAIRVLGHGLYPTPVEGVLTAFISGTLTEAQMNAIYLSAKTSLAAGGITI